ncbi:MAG: hypothetical protein JWO14_1068 [Solirubrobacterales bacterium]|nr:hypothetical protein [Solirubrobacterales bacterium]
MATDLYVDGQRWRVVSSPVSTNLLQRLRDDFGSVNTIFGLEVLDEYGNQGVMRLDPSRLASIAIVDVPD